MVRPYHHGDLRRALLTAAWALLDEGGLEAITLRAVARRAGVSHAAPHHHFASKAALVEAMVVAAFESFAAELQQAWDDGLVPTSRAATAGLAEGPLAALASVGFAYIRFATTRPRVFALLNRPELRCLPGAGATGAASPEVEAAAARAYHVLERGVAACQAAGQIAPGDPQPWALLAWSGVHGLAMILANGLIDTESGPSAEQLSLALLRGLQHGLAVRPA